LPLSLQLNGGFNEIGLQLPDLRLHGQSLSFEHLLRRAEGIPLVPQAINKRSQLFKLLCSALQARNLAIGGDNQMIQITIVAMKCFELLAKACSTSGNEKKQS